MIWQQWVLLAFLVLVLVQLYNKPRVPGAVFVTVLLMGVVVSI